MTAVWRQPARIRGGAAALAAARTGIGVVALVSPELVGRPWVGDAAGTAQGRLFARALGGRDLALGLGALVAISRIRPGSTDGSADGPDGLADGPDGLADGPDELDGLASAGLWVGMGAAADLLDVLATVTVWPKLPAVGRWLVALSAGGAAVTGGAVAWTLRAASRPLITGQAGRAA